MSAVSCVLQTIYAFARSPRPLALASCDESDRARSDRSEVLPAPSFAFLVYPQDPMPQGSSIPKAEGSAVAWGGRRWRMGCGLFHSQSRVFA